MTQPDFSLVLGGPLFQLFRRAHLSGDAGRLASRYVKAFDDRWVRGAVPADDALLGSGDIQSLADLGNSYAVVQEMRFAPFGFKDVTRLATTAIVPLLPLTLTIFSLEELVGHAIRVVF